METSPQSPGPIPSQNAHNPKQVLCYEDVTRHRAMFCGRRGGKTWLINQCVGEAACESPPGAITVYGGPSNVHAMELMWEPMSQWLWQHGVKHKARISKQRFNLPQGRKIYILGAENIDRIRGHKVYFFAGDEFAYWKKLMDAWRKAIRPALADYAGVGLYGGRSLWGTTPAGKGTEGYEFFMAANEAPDWGVHSWHTTDNPWIDPEEVEAAKRELDEFSFRQEFEASWETFSDLAYYSFREDIHVKQQPELNLALPLKLCFDFNVNPTTLLLSQYDRKKQVNRFLREYSLNNSSTEDTVQLFCDDYEDNAQILDIRIRGDASGRARSSTTGRSDYQYVHEILTKRGFVFKHEVPAKNPAIVDRLKHFNGWLKPVSGDHRVEVDPSCKDLIKDLATQGLKGRQPDPSNNLGHKGDAAGYDIYFEQITRNRKPQRTVRL